LFLPLDKKTRINCLSAATKMFSGNCSITAPIVPPSTIIIAVGCVTWAMLPPSIIKPPRIPMIASRMPPTLAMSMN
jgi:hypothetical protein